MTEEKEQTKSTEAMSEQPVTMDETEEFTFDMSMKKKKKKKKPSDEEVAAVGSTTTGTISKESLVNDDGTVGIEEGGGGVAFSEENNSTLDNNDNNGSGRVTGEAWLDSDRDYTFAELLGRVFGILRANNPDLAGDRRKFTIIPPIIGREGSKKTAFTNIAELCRRMRRPVEHVTSFLLTEMGTTGSVDGNQRLIIKGRLQQLQVENLLRRYIGEYVTCKTCRSPETQLTKENRLFFMKCDSCGSQRSVAAIKAGFKAQTGRRVRTD